MASMTSKRRNKDQIDWRSDWWLWPSALLLAVSGWGQAMWMWDHTLPEGIAPLWLLLWTGVGVVGLTLPVQWLARRWWPIAWVAAAAWAGVPTVREMADQYRQTPQTEYQWLHSISPLLLLLLLGVGLSGVMMGASWYARQRWSGPTPNVRPLRQGFWSGLFVVICGWLLINRAFTLVLAALLAGALVLIEAYLVIRESPTEQSKRRKP
jgi:hypothetical protein